MYIYIPTFTYHTTIDSHKLYTHTTHTYSYTSPASATTALTVSATGQSDTPPYWANYGSVVDIYAPGVNINSASHQGDSYYVQMSGTSMATPAAAGAVACVMGTSPSSACRYLLTLGDVCDAWVYAYM